jgi:hypothetical protein
MSELIACDKCHAPPFSRLPRMERWLSWVCYWLVMHWPDRWFVSKPHLAILPWAGNVGFSCHCPTRSPYHEG